MGLEYDMQLIMSGVLNCVQLVGVASSLWSMDRIGRRPLLLWGSLVMFIAHLIISILVGKFSHDWPSYRPEGWASVAMLLVYMLAFGASWASHRLSSCCQHPLMRFNRVRYHGQCHLKSSHLRYARRALPWRHPPTGYVTSSLASSHHLWSRALVLAHTSSSPCSVYLRSSGYTSSCLRRLARPSKRWTTSLVTTAPLARRPGVSVSRWPLRPGWPDTKQVILHTHSTYMHIQFTSSYDRLLAIPCSVID